MVSQATFQSGVDPRGRTGLLSEDGRVSSLVGWRRSWSSLDGDRLLRLEVVTPPRSAPEGRYLGCESSSESSGGDSTSLRRC